ncbi:signal recognition particle-docking protein FtsY [bacterium]|nr:signal recognition particle-docking protein FtsY [bacterium]
MFFKKKQTHPIESPSDVKSGITSKPVRDKKSLNGSNGARFGLLKTRTSVLEKISNLFKKNVETENLWSELEQILIESDMGVRLSCEVLENLKKDTKRTINKDEILKNLEKEIFNNLLKIPRNLNVCDTPPSVILVLGVNGVGKTLTTGKLAYKLKNEGKKVILAAGDTFRAAAIEQLGVFSKKIDIDIIKHSHGADPAAVCYDAIEAAQARGADFLLIDTAGRSHVDKSLMESLKKIKRVIENRLPGALKEVLLVLDATTGQNALSQAKVFTDSLGVTGIVLTKLDGTAKGGIIVAIEQEMKVPIKFVGTGENLENFEVFDPNVFVASLFEE